MSKRCAKCTKTVYPTEELKCLDKIWHKACFKCEVCGMTLNMKNYKGYEKLPYCSAHYPTTKHTQVADTPEARRIAENTKIQSQKAYPTSVADPVQYHADFEKQKGHKTSVAEDPETARIKQNTAIQSNINYWGVKEQRNAMEERRPHEAVDDVGGRLRNPGKISDYDPGIQQFNSPYSGKPQANIVYDSHRGEGQRSHTDGRRSNTESLSNPGRRQPGSISDYDPMSQRFGSNIGTDHRQGGYQAHPEPVRQPAYQPPPSKQPAYQPPPSQPQKNRGLMCKALYDYTAADTDEVSFADGDIIIECQPVDAGWMTGRVERTGQYGMLPSNYVERIN